MTNEKMTITKALSELKILDKRISEEIGKGVFCTYNRHMLRTYNGISLPETKAKMQGTYDKIMNLINRNNAIKKAVAQKNAETTVTIGGNQMTIAEAIYMKTSGIQYYKSILTAMSVQYTQAQGVINRNNGDNLTKACDEYITKLFGAVDNKSVSDEISKSIEAARVKYFDENTFDLIEGFNVSKEIENLKNYIDTFEAEVDAAITVANATTEIEINY